MQTFDVITGVVFLVSFLYGLKRGLVLEAAGIAAFFIGLWGAVRFSRIVQELLSEKFDFECTHIIAFAVTLVVITVVSHLLISHFGQMIGKTPLGWLNRVGGAVFCSVKSLFIVGSVIYACTRYAGEDALLNAQQRSDSLTYNTVLDVTAFIIDHFDLPDAQTIRETVEGGNG